MVKTAASKISYLSDSSGHSIASPQRVSALVTSGAGSRVRIKLWLVSSAVTHGLEADAVIVSLTFICSLLSPIDVDGV